MAGDDCQARKEPSGGLAEHNFKLSYVQMIIKISTSGPGLPMADGQKPMPVSVRPFRGA
jgi:hypothetical protein